MIKDYEYVRTIDLNVEKFNIGGTPSDKYVVKDKDGNQKIAIYNSGKRGINFFRLDNCKVLQHKDGSFYITNIGYAYPCAWTEDAIFHIHDKLKVKKSRMYGNYVDTKMGRCYVNTLMFNAIPFEKFPNTNGKPFIATFPKVAFFKRHPDVCYTINDFKDGTRVDFNYRCSNNAATVQGFAWYKGTNASDAFGSRLVSLDELTIEV